MKQYENYEIKINYMNFIVKENIYFKLEKEFIFRSKVKKW